MIPARLPSNRLPRKALVDICGLPMVIRLSSLHAGRALDEAYVATDSAGSVRSSRPAVDA